MPHWYRVCDCEGPNVMRSRRCQQHQWEIHSAKVTVTVGGRGAKLHAINNPNDDDDDAKVSVTADAYNGRHDADDDDKVIMLP